MWRCVTLLLCAGTALALLLPEKRSEMSPIPFATWPRYGRSPSRLMATRNDRFFSPRYGKRSSLGHGTHEPHDQHDHGGSSHESCERISRAVTTLLCDYTGVPTFYRCTNNENNRKTDSRGPSDGK